MSVKVSGIERLVGYKLYLTDDMSRVFNHTQFRVSMYTYKPSPHTEDPLNLVALLAKFPEDDIDKNIKAIVSFPFNRETIPYRFFVYYLGNVSNLWFHSIKFDFTQREKERQTRHI